MSLKRPMLWVVAAFLALGIFWFLWTKVLPFASRVVDQRAAKITQLETTVAEALKRNAKATQEIVEAKARAEAAMVKFRKAERRAIAAEAIASMWQERSNELIRERAQLKKLANTSQALAEMRRLGWLD